MTRKCGPCQGQGYKRGRRCLYCEGTGRQEVAAAVETAEAPQSDLFSLDIARQARDVAVQPVSGPIERFWQKVTRQENGCWIFTGKAETRLGWHPQFWYDGKNQPAHRVSWELANGPIPAGMCVLHRCDVPRCVNPEHLFLGSKADNNADRDAKGRHDTARGEAHYLSSMTDVDVVHIRALRALGYAQPAIARMLDMTERQVSSAIDGWDHISRELSNEAKAEALLRVEANAADDWRLAAWNALRLLCERRPEVTTDDLWEVMDAREERTHERRAMGALMQRAAREGLITKTDRTVPSLRPECHGRDVRVWSSRLYRQGVA